MSLDGREQFYQELVRAREVERRTAIAEGKMDDPQVPKRLDEAITMVGTCMDMCPRFERYRRERENNLFNWEVIPGTKRIDHKRAVKMYERAAGDKTLPSDLRPPHVLKRTLDYLFHELLHKEGFSPTFDFIRDRSRAVRNDFTVQHNTGPLAIECHERCARFHILALHFERHRPGFSIALEEQQLMNTLQSLKEFYEDQRERYESPKELEMRIYHRLIHIRDQRERHDGIPPAILSHPVFVLTTKFRRDVQAKSSPITKSSPLIVDEEGMLHFSELAALLREQGNKVMVFLVACILERLFGKDTIEDIEAIRGDIPIPNIIDGVNSEVEQDEEESFLRENGPIVEEPDDPAESQPQPNPLKPSATEWLTNNFGVRPSSSAMLGAGSSTSVFGKSPNSAFGSSIPAPELASSSAASVVPSVASAFANLKTTPNVFSNRSFGTGSAFGTSSSAFGTSSSPFASTSSVPLTSGTVDGQSALPDFAIAGSSFQPLSTSMSAPVLSNIGNLGASTSPFGSPFAKSTTPSMLPTPPTEIGAPSSSTFPASKSVPSGFPSAIPDLGLRAGPTPLMSTAATSEPNLNQVPATVLNPKALAFTPGQPFGLSSTTSVQAEKGSITDEFSPSLSFPVASTSTTSTRPILPPINTSPLTSFSTSRDGVRPGDGSAPSEIQETNATPQHPPPLKVHPISLPGTPTGRSFSSPTKAKSTNLFAWPSVQSNSEPDILSPLVISAKNSLTSLPSPPVSARPSVSRFPSTVELPVSTEQPGPSHAAASEPLPSPKAGAKGRTSPLSPQDVEMASPIAVPTRNGKSKGKGKAPVEDAEGLKARASSFARTSALVRGALRRWAAKASERVLYNDAVRRSDAYTGQKTKKRQDTQRDADAVPEVKRTARTRARHRVSAKYTQPQSDAELARRLKENHEQHERRWAPGTFLAAFRAHVGSPTPFDYCLWLSLNPDNDGTAIWVERKFDVPRSGAWVSERVFSIPLAPDAAGRSPGLVVFERTPLHGVDDDIEKKFRILDDCARLREVIETFPEDRHFIPSIMFILWSQHEAEALPDDLHRMVHYEVKGIIGSHSTFSLSSTTKDLDERFRQVLSSMDLDTAGGLVEILSRQGILNSRFGKSIG
ncbi:SAC3/GANP/Nin1/mts3/eIF-3 p25 family-domain-containing protein [Russula earlei]|uniref:SAC3/GANP/Nin1/mts3/eIF-3 p25 family-domain-containing protein n=1 Tax=Russula earlei TaxID=71964 RepID=A0ACC0UGC2_9AGAM|nr:SAC3/GANP/Nin1/mts3/eIF-3 p25 family-domain-containing protein [Russula earlei]